MDQIRCISLVAANKKFDSLDSATSFEFAQSIIYFWAQLRVKKYTNTTVTIQPHSAKNESYNKVILAAMRFSADNYKRNDTINQ